MRIGSVMYFLLSEGSSRMMIFWFFAAYDFCVYIEKRRKQKNLRMSLTPNLLTSDLDYPFVGDVLNCFDAIYKLFLPRRLSCHARIFYLVLLIFLEMSHLNGF